VKNNIITAVQTTKALTQRIGANCEKHRNTDLTPDEHLRLTELTALACNAVANLDAAFDKLRRPTVIPRKTMVRYIGEVARITERKSQ